MKITNSRRVGGFGGRRWLVECERKVKLGYKIEIKIL